MSETPTSKLVTVFGGSGFLGRYVVRELARRGWRVRAAVRRPDLAGFLQPMGVAGQVMPVQANLRREHRWSVERAVEGADAVVNLVGILAESGRQTFAGVQARGAETLADVCAKAGIADLVHVSAIGADAASRSAYARSKAAGEAAVLNLVPSAVVLRPSVLFGAEDTFFNRLGAMARLAPVLPLFGGGATKFQPVYVGDVAEGVANAVDGRAKPGTVYELGGPQVVTFRECVEQVMALTAQRRALLPVPFGVTGFLAGLIDWLPGAPITRDQVELLKSHNVVSESAMSEGRTLEALAGPATTLAAILPTYLWRYRPHGQFERGNAA